MNTVEKQLISLQTQLDHLNAEVATLLAQASASPYTVSTPANSHKSQVGLNRYRQLAHEQLNHTTDPADRYVVRQNG